MLLTPFSGLLHTQIVLHTDRCRYGDLTRYDAYCCDGPHCIFRLSHTHAGLRPSSSTLQSSPHSITHSDSYITHTPVTRVFHILTSFLILCYDIHTMSCFASSLLTYICTCRLVDSGRCSRAPSPSTAA